MLPHTYYASPTPHICFPELLPPDVYAKVKFPTDIPIRAAGRSGRDLFMGEPGFAEAIHSDGLRELHQLFMSAEFVRWVLSIFEEDLVRYHCRVNAKDARLIDFLETREALDKWPQGLPGDYDADELFTRFDFTIGGSNYTPYVHLDSPRRIIGGMLFLSDAGKEGMDGGEFTLYRDLLFNNDRIAHWPVLAKKFPVKENTGVLFLNGNRGFHGPAAIRSIQGSRRWVYYSISSRIAVWEPGTSRPVSRVAIPVFERLGLGWRLRRPYNPKSKIEANRQRT